MIGGERGGGVGRGKRGGGRGKGRRGRRGKGFSKIILFQ